MDILTLFYISFAITIIVAVIVTVNRRRRIIESVRRTQNLESTGYIYMEPYNQDSNPQYLRGNYYQSNIPNQGQAPLSFPVSQYPPHINYRNGVYYQDPYK